MCNATVDVPVWDGGLAYLTCPYGRLKFTNGQYPATDPRLKIVKFLNTDVDHNGDAETIVLVHCLGEPGPQQLLAIDRTSAGALVTMGNVVEEDDHGVVRIFDLAAHQNGSILVQAVDRYGSVDEAYASAVFQWRTFGWNGRQFIQTAGLTSFVVDRSTTPLTFSLSPVVFAAPIETLRHGTLTATVHNSGTTPAVDATIRVIFYPDFFHASQNSCTTDSTFSIAVITCSIADIPPGATRDITIGLTIAQADVATFIELGNHNDAQLLLGDQLYTTVDIPSVTFQ